MKKLRQIGGNFLFLFRPYWRYGKAFIIISLISAAVAVPIGQVAGVTVAQAVIDTVMAGETFGTVLKVVGMYFGVYAVTQLLQTEIDFYYSGWKKEQIGVRIREDIFWQAMRTDLKWIDDPAYFNNFRLALDRFERESQRTLSFAVQFVTSLITSLSMVGVIAQVGIEVALIVAAGQILAIILQSKLVSEQMKVWPEEIKLRRRLDYTTRICHQSNYAPDLKSTRSASLLMRLYRGGAEEYVAFVRRNFRRFMRYTLGSDFVSRIAQYGVILYIAYGLLTGRVESVGVYATLIAASTVLSSNLSTFSFIFPQMNEFNQAANMIREFFSLSSPIETSKGIEPPQDQFELELADVSFAYPNNPNFALRNISLVARPGEKIAIVGENGAGKTTMMKLMLRLYDVDGGEIRVNGRSIREYDVHALRLRVGVAFQQPSVYAMSLRDNLQTYREAEDATLREALEQSGLGRLKDDLDQEITREFRGTGIVLSGGETQKLALARIFAGDFGLLLLDEPSSALDPLAEYELMKQLLSHANKTTTIMIAHRLSTVRHFDRIYVVDKGQIIEEGTHEELMSLGGKYAEMFSKQAENYVS